MKIWCAEDCNVELRLSSGVVSHILKHRQMNTSQPEAGGQLFADFDTTGRRWNVLRATGPRRNDRRGRAWYLPDRKTEQDEIDRAFREGLHYIGDWHTHPEATPSPSTSDMKKISEIVAQSRYELPGFIMLIVGTSTSDHWWISIHGKKRTFAQFAALKS